MNHALPFRGFRLPISSSAHTQLEPPSWYFTSVTDSHTCQDVVINQSLTWREKTQFKVIVLNLGRCQICFCSRNKFESMLNYIGYSQTVHHVFQNDLMWEQIFRLNIKLIALQNQAYRPYNVLGFVMYTFSSFKYVLSPRKSLYLISDISLS